MLSTKAKKHFRSKEGGQERLQPVVSKAKLRGDFNLGAFDAANFDNWAQFGHVTDNGVGAGFLQLRASQNHFQELQYGEFSGLYMPRSCFGHKQMMVCGGSSRQKNRQKNGQPG